MSKHNSSKTRTNTGWILCADIQEKAKNSSNVYVYGTMDGAITVKYSFGFYKAELKFPVSRVLILPNDFGMVEIVAASLGAGLKYISATNMNMSK